MIRVLLIAVATSAGALATHARGAPDAGAPISVAEGSPDGGLPRSPSPRHDARADTGETVRLRVELSALEQRVVALEQAVERERQQNEQLRKVAAQLQALHDEQAGVLAARQKNEKTAADRSTQLRSAITGLVTALHQLQTGDANVGWAIDAAQAAPMGPTAQKNLELARTALYNEDLSVAGSYLARAITEAQAFSAQ